MQENPRLLSLGMNGIPERSGGQSSLWPKAPAFRPGIGLLTFSLLWELRSISESCSCIHDKHLRTSRQEILLRWAQRCAKTRSIKRHRAKQAKTHSISPY